MDVSPPLEAWQEYYDGWKSFDGDARLTETETEGIPGTQFMRADDSRWNQIFRLVGRKAMHREITFTLPLQEVAVHCERLYRCENGHWVRTDRTRKVEADPVAKPKSLHLEGDALQTNECVVLCRNAVTAWKAAEEERHRLSAFYCR